MKDKKTTIGAAALVAVIASAGFAASTFAYQGDPNVQGPNFNEETHEAVLNAFENKDYNAWKEAKPNLGHGRMVEQVNEDNFNKFAEMREARLAGDTETADALRAELGLGQGQMRHGNGVGHRQGHGQGHGQGRHAENRGQSQGGNFVDANGDGVCDLME